MRNAGKNISSGWDGMMMAFFSEENVFNLVVEKHFSF